MQQSDTHWNQYTGGGSRVDDDDDVLMILFEKRAWCFTWENQYYFVFFFHFVCDNNKWRSNWILTAFKSRRSLSSFSLCKFIFLDLKSRK